MAAKEGPSTKITVRQKGVLRPSPESNNFVKATVNSVTAWLIQGPFQSVAGERSNGAVTRGLDASNRSTPCQT